MIFSIPPGINLTELTNSTINELRAAKGLQPKKSKQSAYKGHTITSYHDGIYISDVLESDNFIRLNLNDGDSWAYYVSKSYPEIIHSFKSDEEKYFLKDIDPDFYKKLKSEAETYLEKDKFFSYYFKCKKHNSKFHIGFRDAKTDAYWVGYHDFSDGSNHFHIVKSKDRICDYLAQHKAPILKRVRTVQYDYLPSAKSGISIENETPFINRFQPSKYLSSAKKYDGTEIPKSVAHLINHLIGNDSKMFDKLINSLAVIFQYRIRTGTAFIFQGTTGTGKGLFFNEILRPLFGDQNFSVITLNNLEENFNQYMENSLILCVDEVDTDQVKSSPKLIGKIKNFITEPSISIRAMYSNLKTANNHMTVFMASNHHNPFRIEKGDRRFNVCNRQENKLFSPGTDTVAEVQSIRDNLQAFADFLYSYKADISAASVPLENEAKLKLQEITATSIETIANHLREGNLEYFLEHLPDKKGSYESKDVYFDHNKISVNDHFYSVISDAADHVQNKKDHLLNHADLFVLFTVLCGAIPDTKTKLGSFLGKNGIHINPQNVKGKTERRHRVKWKCSKIKLKQFADILSIKYNGLKAVGMK